MSVTKLNVLSCFKRLHKTASKIFEGDQTTLAAARLKINEEFKKNKHITDKQSIMEMMKFATEVENELKTSVVQAKQTEPGVYEMKLTENTKRLDNVMFKEDAIIPSPRKGSKKCK